MTRKLLLAAFVLTLVLTGLAAHHQLTNAAPNMASPPRNASPLERPGSHPQFEFAPQSPTWQVVAGGGGRDIDLMDIDTVTPDEAWAVGATGPSSYYGAIMHYTNTIWSEVTTPTGAYDIEGVEMVGPDEGWAVGSRSVPCNLDCIQGLLLHYTKAGGWQTADLPSIPGGGSWDTLRDVDLRGSTGWAVGYGHSTSNTQRYFLQYSGGTWAPVPIPSPIVGYGVSVIDETEAWAVGESTSPYIQMAHFAGGVWSSVFTSSVPFNGHLRAVHMLNANEGWAAGYTQSGSSRPYTYQCLTLHYKDGLWTRVACSAPTRLSSIYARGPNDVWAVGSGGPMLHYNGSIWTNSSPPAGTGYLYSVKLVGTDDGWAVGSDGIILRLINGT